MALLLTSSWCVVEGIEAFRRRVTDRARRLFGAALLLGIGFVLVKVVEYGEKVRDGIVATTNEFFMFYYVLTGIHLLHLLIGLGVLAWMRVKSKSQWSAQRDIELMECGGLYGTWSTCSGSLCSHCCTWSGNPCDPGGRLRVRRQSGWCCWLLLPPRFGCGLTLRP